MAKHFREAPVDDTKTLQRPHQARRMAPKENSSSLPYGQAASYHYSYPSAAVTDDYPYGEPARGGVSKLLRGLLLLIAWTLRLAALALCLLVLLNALSISSLRPLVTQVTDMLTSPLPSSVVVRLSVDTPFGGVFRGDVAVCSFVLFVLDWLLCRLRAGLR